MTAGRRRLLQATIAILALAIGLVTVRFWPRPPLSQRIPSSTAVLDAEGHLLRLTMSKDQQYRLWTPLDKVAPEFLAALLLHEDQHFYDHAGVNPVSLARAAAVTYSGGMRQGGSTITMQLARLLYRLNTRPVSGKLQQIVLALGLELRYSKRELLEAHINLLPYGGDVQGVGAASLIFFGKTPAQLALNEVLTLVLIPQAPTLRSPSSNGEPVSLTAARRRLFAQWVALHPQAADQAGLMTLPLHYNSTRGLPFEAPHFTATILSHSARDKPIIRTTLSLARQRVVEQVLQGYVREQERLGVHNAAALLVDTRDMGVEAMVGSARFSDDSISGQVNGTLAKRSPGSALKPFIYALAIDQGLIHPLTMLKDAPTSFGAYSPENFDGRFAGPLSATNALIRSRNVPAVALTARLSQPGLYDFLREAGVAHMASQQHYGLSLALGGGEVTMEEMATLYAMLANEGVLRPLRHRAQERVSVGTRLLSEQAAFLTETMLLENPRPDDSPVRTQKAVQVAWKTGTSWGFRDAWTAGLFDHYVLIVWVGNFDSTSNPAFVGIQTAAPLFFRIFDALHAVEPAMADLILRAPKGVTHVAVCAASGDLPNAECPQTVLTWFIPGKSPIRISDVHRRVWYDTRTGTEACPPYDLQFVRSEVFELWPSDVMRLFEEAGMPRRRPPAPASCQHESADNDHAPQIRSPLSNTTYTLRAARIASETIPLAATTDGSVRTVHWFVDDAYVGTSQPDVAVGWVPGRSGEFTVRAIDDRGRADSRTLRVAVIP
jgi:penicillin-binding protein 1C